MNKHTIKIGDMVRRLCGSIGVVSEICEWTDSMHIRIMHSPTMGCETIRVPRELIGVTWEYIA